jgi:hypothetical protein
MKRPLAGHTQRVQRLSPSWRNALVSIPVLAAGPALVLLACQVSSATGLYAGLALSLYALRTLLLIQCATTRLWPDGFENRLLGAEASVPWEQVERLIVVPTLFGRFLQVELAEGSRITLAAPRSGLLSRAEDFDRDLTLIREAPGGGRARLRLERSPLAGQPSAQAVLLVCVLGAVVFALSHTGG